MKHPEYWDQAIRELARRDRVLKRLTTRYPGMGLRSRGDAFHTLARSIVGQQISVKAADRVWQRFAAALPKVAPEPVAAADEALLRSCGLSRQKAAYLQDLATGFVEGRLRPRSWRTHDDAALMAELTRIKGIGRWTAEMLLIFHLMRPDVLPLDDLGLRRAVSLHYNGGTPLSKAEVRDNAEPWAPWRSVATWYLWRSLDPVPVEY